MGLKSIVPAVLVFVGCEEAVRSAKPPGPPEPPAFHAHGATPPRKAIRIPILVETPADNNEIFHDDMLKEEPFAPTVARTYHPAFDRTSIVEHRRDMIGGLRRSHWYGWARPMNLVAMGGGGRDTEDAVLAGLRWLSRNQNPDGSWSAPGQDEFAAGVTGLVLLAFLGAGHSHLSRDTYDGICFGNVIRDGLKWILAHQDVEGCIGQRTPKYMYGHAICTYALAEACTLSGSMIIKDSSQRAIDFLVSAQNPGSGWRYSSQPGESDTSVTGWAMTALASAEYAGLKFPLASFKGVQAWFNAVTDESGAVQYTIGETNDRGSMTAIGAYGLMLIKARKSDRRISGSTQVLIRSLSEWSAKPTDYYYWFWGSLAIFQYDGPSGRMWKAWNASMKEAILPNQNGPSSGGQRGSWDPVGRWCTEGGRFYATAINTLTLQIYYHYRNVFGGDRSFR